MNRGMGTVLTLLVFVVPLDTSVPLTSVSVSATSTFGLSRSSLLTRKPAISPTA